MPAILGAIFGTLSSYFLIIFLGDFTIKIAASGLLIWVIIKTIRQLRGKNAIGEDDGISPEKITKEKVIEETGPYADYNLSVPAGDYLKSIIDKPKEERNFIERSMLSINKSYKTNKIKNEKTFK